MDETPEYIKMCEKANNIQELFKTEHYARSGSGHFIAHWYEDNPDQKHVSCLDVHTHLDRRNWCLFRPGEGMGSHTPEKYTKSEEIFIWLPRQDQLQEMIKVVDNKPHKLISALWEHIAKVLGCPPKFNSMEQLWLVFLMWNNFNKVWNGEDWVVA